MKDKRKMAETILKSQNDSLKFYQQLVSSLQGQLINYVQLPSSVSVSNSPVTKFTRLLNPKNTVQFGGIWQMDLPVNIAITDIVLCMNLGALGGTDPNLDLYARYPAIVAVERVRMNSNNELCNIQNYTSYVSTVLSQAKMPDFVSSLLTYAGGTALNAGGYVCAPLFLGMFSIANMLQGSSIPQPLNTKGCSGAIQLELTLRTDTSMKVGSNAVTMPTFSTQPYALLECIENGDNMPMLVPLFTIDARTIDYKNVATATQTNVDLSAFANSRIDEVCVSILTTSYRTTTFRYLDTSRAVTQCQLFADGIEVVPYSTQYTGSSNLVTGLLSLLKTENCSQSVVGQYFSAKIGASPSSERTDISGYLDYYAIKNLQGSVTHNLGAAGDIQFVAKSNAFITFDNNGLKLVR